jgi:hypothetical protein
MQQLSSQVLEGNAAADGAAAAGTAARGSFFSSNSGSNSSSGAAAAAGAGEDALSAATASVLDQMAGLQQLMQAEAHKHQEVFDSALKVRQCSAALVAQHLFVLFLWPPFVPGPYECAHPLDTKLHLGSS